MGYSIAIDGPAGAGKSTAAKIAAKKLGFIYVDTGAIYRALAVFFLDRGLLPSDREGIIKALDGADISIGYEDGAQHVFLNGEDVTHRLREENVGSMASAASSMREVRQKLLELQRQLAQRADVVMEGRDIGTTILPDAELKIYLTASESVRAKRRFDELSAKGEQCDFDEIKSEINKRDERDKNRAESPLRQAADAVVLDTSFMSAQEAADEIIRLSGRKALQGK